ncbi:MAG: hypothetical protein ACO3A2_05205 [Bdellovibrionia bacterium]
MIKKNNNESQLLFFIGMTLFLGGSLASLGGHLEYAYFYAFHWWSWIMTFFCGFRVIQNFLLKRNQVASLIDITLFNRFLLVLMVFFLGAAASGFAHYQRELKVASRDPSRFFVEELGGYLDQSWSNYISYSRQAKDKKIIEEYFGIFSAMNRSLPPWPVDSVIHALGRVRDEAASKMSEVDLVVSTRYVTSRDWQPWNLSQSFWFYEQLLNRWEPDFTSPNTVVWRKSPSPRIHEKVGCRITEQQNAFFLDSDLEGYYAVRVTYESTGAGRSLLMLKNNISYAADARGYVSLPHGRSTVMIPVLIQNKLDNFFDLKIIGGYKDSYHSSITACEAERISFKGNDVLPSHPWRPL